MTVHLIALCLAIFSLGVTMYIEMKPGPSQRQNFNFWVSTTTILLIIAVIACFMEIR